MQDRQGKPFLLLSENSSHLLPYRGHNTRPLAPFIPSGDENLPPDSVTTPELDFDMAAMGMGLSVYNAYSQEYMHSHCPAVGSQLNESEPAWQRDGGFNDDKM